MSYSYICDRCSARFDENTAGHVRVHDISVYADEAGEGQTWGGIDFCPKCGKDVLAVIGEAIEGNPALPLP